MIRQQTFIFIHLCVLTLLPFHLGSFCQCSLCICIIVVWLQCHSIFTTPIVFFFLAGIFLPSILQENMSHSIQSTSSVALAFNDILCLHALTVPKIGSFTPFSNSNSIYSRSSVLCHRPDQINKQKQKKYTLNCFH